MPYSEGNWFIDLSFDSVMKMPINAGAGSLAYRPAVIHTFGVLHGTVLVAEYIVTAQQVGA